ncbi:TPR-like protein [Peniophora sp. CONT]|nr:TPR-like protein [Peniophora sp. CONT]
MSGEMPHQSETEAAYKLFELFEASQDLAYLDQAIAAMQDIIAQNHHCPNPTQLARLVVDDLVDIDEAISLLRRAVDLTVRGHLDYASALQLRFDRLGELDDLEGATSAVRLAIELTPNDHIDRAECLANLGSNLQNLNDLEGAISAGRLAIELTPDDHPDKPGRMSNLGVALQDHFERLGDLDDLERSINAHHKLIRLNNLSIALQIRFESLGELDDLEDAISTQRHVVDRTADDDPGKPARLNNLGIALEARFERLAEIDDLNTAVSIHSLAAELSFDEDPDKPAMLNSMANAMQSRFECLGDIEDLRRAISAQEQAVDLTMEGHPDRPGRLNNLSVALQTRFERLGDLQDLESAIATQRLAVAATPKDHPDKPIQLSTLSSALQVRFERLGELSDLEEAISAQRIATELTPEGHPDKPARLSNLGNLLRNHFERRGLRDDIESAISSHRRAIASTVDGHPSKSVRFYSLGNALGVRFKSYTELADLEEAIAALQYSVDHTPDSHPHKPSRLSSLANFVFDRFRCLNELQDLESSISTHRLAVAIAQNDHPNRASLLNNLGNVLRSRLERDVTKPNFDATMDCFMAAATQPLCAPFVRLQCSKKCARLVTRFPQFASPESTLLAYSRVMDVLPQIVWLGHSVNRRYDETAKLGEWVSAGVSTAVQLGALPQAVEWLEAGRSFVWSQVLSLRTSFDELREHHPLLAEKLEAISKELQITGNVSNFTTSRAVDTADSDDLPDFTTTNEAADRHRDLVIKYDRTLAEVRQHTGFEDFLRSPKLSSLLPAVERGDGPIVFINVHSSSCSALVLHAGGAITSVALPDLSEDRARKLRSLWIQNLEWCNTRMRAVLTPDMGSTQRGSANIFGRVLTRTWMWIVHPILQHLDIMKGRDNLSHVTWCPTGPLTQLPLHAAGVYDASLEHQPRMYDFVVSSYTPSLSALLRCRQASSASIQTSQPNLLIVAQPATPGLTRLPGTRDESARLRTVLQQTASTLLMHDQAIVARTQAAMREHPWVHLACHGMQDAKDPTQSAFALYDGRLTLSALMGTTAENAELAFLSACQTAVGDEKVPEEAVHLAAGMLAVGFKGVVATMWSIGDAEAPIVVEAYYKTLLKLRGADSIRTGATGAAYALHEAVKVLRAHVGEDNFVRWAPFVHFGV